MKLRRLMVGTITASLLAACGSSSKTVSNTTAASSGGSTTAAATPTTAAGATTKSIRLWLNGGDTKDELVAYAITEFKKIHPDVDVKFERQQWTGIVEKLTTALSSSDSPDVVELGNTQAQAFEAAGALEDLTAKKADLGGDDLLQSLAEAGTYKDKFYGVPYYAGARVVLYRKDLFAKSGLQVPKTLDEFLAAGVKLKTDNAATPNFSGIYLPGKNWYANLPFIWVEGGDIAKLNGDSWTGELSSAQSLKGLQFSKDVMDKANAAPKDGDDAKDYVAFCNGEVGMMPAPGWKPGQIINDKDGCPSMKDNIGAFALPGLTAGTTSPAFLGGSNIAISAKSKNKDLAYDLVKVLVSKGFQQQFAASGTIPALKSLLDSVSGDDAAKAQAIAAKNSRFVPSSENWAGIEASTVLPDLFVAIAEGGDIQTGAKKADQAIESKLNG